MKVSLLSAPYGHASGSDSMRPIGLMAIHTYLEAAFAGDDVTVDLFDVSDCAASDYHYLDDYDLASYDVVGLCAYSTNFAIVRDWAERIKQRRRDVVTVVGGPHPTALPEHVATAHRAVFDFTVRGEGERPMAAIIHGLLAGKRLDAIRAPGIHRHTAFGVASTGTDPVPDLDDVPVPLAPVISPYARETVYWDRREQRVRPAVAMTSSRGCPFRCTFCSIQASSSKWRAVSAARLADWIRHALATETPTPEHVYFMDADFSINRNRVVEIGAMFAAQFPQLTWSFSARVDDLARLGDDTIGTLTRQGLVFVETGIESGSQAMLDRMNKNVSVAENYAAIELLKRHDLYLGLDFILFLPDETPEQLRESLDWLRAAGLTEFLPHDHFYTFLLPYPGTPLRDDYERLFGVEFPVDVLPEPDDYFLDPRTRRVFKHFIRDFRPLREQLPDLVNLVDRAALDLAATEPERAQRLRLEAMSLRNLPYRVLDALLRDPLAPSLVAAVPWLADFDTYVKELQCLATTPDQLAA